MPVNSWYSWQSREKKTKKLFLFSGKKRKPSDVELEEVMPSFDNIEELPTPFIYEDEVTEEE